MPIEVKYEPGTVEMVEQHDGSKLALRKLDADYECTTAPPRSASCSTRRQRQIVTGLLYIDEGPPTCTRTSHRRWPLNLLGESELAPPGGAGQYQAGLR